MAHKTIAVPLYLFDDDQLTAWIQKMLDVMTELAGESDTTDLPPLIQIMRDELARRGSSLFELDDNRIKEIRK